MTSRCLIAAPASLPRCGGKSGAVEYDRTAWPRDRRNYPKELASVRALTPELNFLVPGIGAQGGDINACVQSGMNAQKTGMVINSSRAVLYASSGEDFKEKAREVAMQTRDAINAARGL